ncbi:hypothetical protein [Flavobacterium sp. ASW18X]|uniref:hypothetical protein n=1 Tax=Flavobacterium sp. ASW18X TaxID=2572595 RepID=UPI0010ADDFC0|nr:hypothetical protein [Flavobacterium sp. ASW18X]TKD65911.1 hypothetical protein FBT53_03325 [Flavobacterium sp. ASW18X]
MWNFKAIFFIYLTLFLLCCKRNTSNFSDSILQPAPLDIVKKCFTKQDKENILESIMGTEEFQMFLHPEIDGRLPILLVKSEFISTDLELFSNGQKVEYVDSLNLPNGRQHRIKLLEMDCEKNIIKYSIFYPIEGAIISGSVKKKENIWVPFNTSWGEKN